MLIAESIILYFQRFLSKFNFREPLYQSKKSDILEIISHSYLERTMTKISFPMFARLHKIELEINFAYELD